MALKFFEMQDYRRRIERIIQLKHPRKVTGRHMPWRLIGKRRTKATYEFAFQVPIGSSYLDIEKQVDALAASCGALVEIKNRAGVVIVAVHTEDFPNLISFEQSMLHLAKGRAALLGYDIDGQPIFHSFKIPHMLIAGQSGYGKTDVIRWILLQLISRFSPDQLEIQIIDMKGFSFLPFRNVPHITRIEKTLDGAVEILDDAYQTMQERADMVWQTGNRDLAKTFKWKIALIDEASQISPDLVSGKLEKKLATVAAQRAAAISCIGREASVGLLFATQYPTREVIHGQIRANMEAVLCFKTENDVHSNVALGSSGAEQITAQGRAYYKSRGSRTMIQVPFVGGDEVWEELLKPYRGGVAGEVAKEEGNHFEYIKDAAGDID